MFFAVRLEFRYLSKKGLVLNDLHVPCYGKLAFVFINVFKINAT